MRTLRPRRVLSLWGVVLGVAAVTLSVATGSAVSRLEATPVAGLDPNLVVISPTGPSASGVQQGFGSGSGLTTRDFEALNDPGLVPDAVTATLSAGLRTDVEAYGHRWRTDVIGTSDGFAQVRGYRVASGRFLTAADLRATSPVAVLGQTVVDNLFAGENPVGRIITADQHSYKVVGVLAPRGYSGPYDQDDVVAVPITVAWAQLLPRSSPLVQQVVLQSPDQHAAAAAEREATQLLMLRHHVSDPARVDFQVQSQADVLAAAARTGKVSTALLAALAVVALLAGVLGVARLMLGAVRSRRREIGIRRALGADDADIAWQFALEGAIATGLAGGAGVVLGECLSLLLPRVLPELAHPMPSVRAALVTLVLSTVVGAMAGAWAAGRATRAQPAAALRP
jgi:putative ABC transport system permease protein